MLKQGDVVMVSQTAANTKSNFGFDSPMKSFLGKPAIVHSWDLGGVRLTGDNQWIWHERDLEKMSEPEDIKNNIKPVLFDPQTIQEGS